MNETPTKEQLGEMDVVVLASALQGRGILMTSSEVADMAEEYQRRAEAWAAGDRAFPRCLLAYLDSDVDSAQLVTDEKMDEQALAEEIADTLRLVGVTVSSPERAFDEIGQFNPEEAEAAAQWTFEVYKEVIRASDASEDAKPVDVPECIKRLLVAPPVEAAPTPRSQKAETREQAVARLQSGLHEVRATFLERQADFNDKSEAAKCAKKSLESAQDTLNDLIGELDDALSSNVWQARLPLNYDATVEIVESPASEVDPAKTAAVSELVKHGISEKQAEKLVDSDVETVAELEQRIRDINGWFRKIKGIGESAADKISDALIAWRAANGYGK